MEKERSSSVIELKLGKMYQVQRGDLVDVETRLEKEIDEAVRFAEDSPYPNPEEALTDLFFEEVK